MARARNKRINRKMLAVLTASVLVVSLLIGGVFAWADFGQMVTNRMRGTPDPDVQLHDDFDREGVDGFHKKEVYAENTGKVPTVIRIRFDEFFQVGNNVMTHDKEGNLSKINDKNTWQPRLFNDVPTITDEMHHHFWNMSGSDKIYLRGITDLGWKDWSNEAVGSVGPNGQQFNKTLPSSTIITMAEYINNRADYDSESAAGCWILDTDGWCYWSKMLLPDTSTNLLLDSVTLNQANHPEENYVYFINVRMEATNSHQYSEMIAQGATENGINFIRTLTGNNIVPQKLQSTINLGKIISNLIDDASLTASLDNAISNGIAAYSNPLADVSALQNAIDEITNNLNALKPGYDILKDALFVTIIDGAAFKGSAAIYGSDVTALGKAIAQGQNTYDRIGSTSTELKKATEAILAAMAAIDFNVPTQFVLKDVEVDDWKISNSVWTSKVRKESSIMIDIHGFDNNANAGIWTVDTLKNFDDTRVNDAWLNIPIAELFEDPTGITLDCFSFTGDNGIYGATNPKGFRCILVGGILKIAYIPSYNEIHYDGFDAQNNPYFLLDVMVTFKNARGELADLFLDIPFYGAWA